MVVTNEKSVRYFVKYPRSVRAYKNDTIKECIQQATPSPTSSNLQFWEFYPVASPAIIHEIAKSNFDQNAAITAQQIVAAPVMKGLWLRKVRNLQHRIL
ncbi:nitroreductase family protein [Flavobacterium sp. LB2P6]|uniref:nitroreductase family protein n=1 Tax=Flavobacterium sp. LB2P6 TaxID=3401714 RepID=UPI003AB016C3